MSPALDPVALVSSVAEALRDRDPAGEASPVFDMATGQRSARVALWEGVELRFWVNHRRLLGDVMHWEVVGRLPDDLRTQAGPHRIEGAENVPELAIALLSATASTLLHKVVIDAPPSADIPSGAEDDVRATLVLFSRARKIRQQLERIAGEGHEGRYKQHALTAAAILAGSQRMAEIALHLESSDFAAE